MKNLFTILFSVIITLTSMPVALSQSPTKIVQNDNSKKKIQTKVKGITCKTDLKMISDNVEKLKGVSSCEASKTAATSIFDIIYDPSLISEKEIYSAIENTGSCENPNEKPYKVKF
ncbi:MAG: hypothetical protein MRY83_21620 [Flavobacteriales bacterium]|nr:hypothetical protein [Flavobacteriales bacterium]